MFTTLLLSALLATSPQTPALESGEAPLRVVLRGGPKTHGEGEHDHPRFVKDWVELLGMRGAAPTGRMEFPDEATLAQADVLVMYAAEGGSIHGEERARLDAFLARGGGLVVLHDAVCGDDPHWFKTVVGGAWEHGHSKWHTGEIGLYIADREHPITRGLANFDFTDEIYWDLHLDPAANVLAHSFHTPFDVTPQMWTFEKNDYRAFVSLQGHYHESFDHPAWQAVLLRGIAWAGKRDADSLLLPGEAAALRYPEGGPIAPERAHEPHALHPEFALSLMAAEPLVVNPISIDWDAEGRAWVACTPGYPYKEESSGVPAHDEIRILHDDDGDGRADRATTFAAGLDLVTSLLHHGDGVLVTTAPYILWLRDTDGDDRADRAEVLYEGFGYGDTHATTSNLRFGMDGWVYGVQGYSGGASNDVRGYATAPRPVWSPSGGRGLGMDGGRPDAQAVGTIPDAGGAVSGRANAVSFGRISNGLFRFRPDGSAIEMVASYGSNTWGLDFAPNGELLFTMANGSHLRHVVLPDGTLSGFGFRAPSWVDVTDHKQAAPISHSDRPPYHQIDFVGGFTAAAGGLVQDGGAWPDEFLGDHFVCEPTINLVHRDRLERNGPTFTASKPRDAEFLASTDLWFRPVHARTAPDGAMVVLDFYNQAAVHNDTRGPKHGPTNAAVRPDRDFLHGRLWRVQHQRATRVASRSLASMDGEQLLEELGSPNSWRRDTALRLLAEGKSPSLDNVVLFSHQAASPAARLRAVWLIDRLGAADDEIIAALEDPDAAVRWNAARIYGRRIADARAAGVDVGDPPEALLVLALDADPRVRLEMLIASSRFAISAEFANEFALDFAGLFTEFEDDWSRAALVQVYRDRPGALLAGALDPEIGASDLAAALLPLVARAGDADGMHAALTAFAAAPDGDDVARLLRIAGESLADDADLSRSGDALRTLLAVEDIEVALAALPLAARLDTAEADTAAVLDRLHAVTADPDADVSARLAALDALLAMPDAASRARGIETAARFLDPYFALEVQIHVIEALGGAMESPDQEAAGAAALIDAFRALSHPARERAFHHLAQRASRITALLDGVEREVLAPNDLGPARRYRLEHHPDEAVATRARAVLATQTNADKDALIAEFLPQVTRPGDPRNGRFVFAENCANCHTFNGQGGHVGPDLTGMGAHGAEALLPFLLDPNREVDPTYVDYVAETFDGRLFTGVLVRETPGEITLRSSTGEEVVQREELESFLSTGRSPMPEGFEDLGAEALRDVLAYLSAGYEDFRVIDLARVATTTTDALYDAKRDAQPMRFRSTGIVDVDGVPFRILDPARVTHNAIALKGGMAADWDSKLKLPQTVTVPVGMRLERVHVLGGIAAWGFPFTDSRDPILRWTWIYADGQREELVLHDGDAFADWIRRHEVPGSVYAEVLQPGSVGQVRHFTLDPSRRDVAVQAIELASFDNHLSPTFLGLTARISGADEVAAVPAAWSPPENASRVIFGGGSSHDFRRWWGEHDLGLWSALPAHGGTVVYEEIPSRLAALLPQAKTLALCNNQALPDPALRAAVFAHVDAGRSLLLMHPATWYNWADWPEYNAELVGGGARGHEPYREFVVTVNDKDHPVMTGVRSSFGITDELYRFEQDPNGSPIHVLATGTSVETGASFPVVWTVERGDARILCTTLGHDGAAHTLPEYETMLRNAAVWLDGDAR